MGIGMYNARIIIFLIIIVLGLFYYIEYTPVTKSGQIEVSTESQLIEVLKQRYPDATDYQLYVSGRTIRINVSDLPFLAGKNPSNVCILAYIGGHWDNLPFTFSDGDEIVYEEQYRTYVVRHVPEEISERTILFVQMPGSEPTYTNPLENVPPQARGAKEWYWIWVKTSETRKSYPILVAIDSPQIREMCGTTAKLYAESDGIAGELNGQGVPWVLEASMKNNDIVVSPNALKELFKPKPGIIDTGVSSNYGPPRNILPDGGGGGEPSSKYILMVTTPKEVVVSDGWSIPQDVLFQLSSGEERTYTLKINSPNYTEIRNQDISITRIIIMVYGKINDPDAYGVAGLDIALYPGTEYEQTKTKTLWSVFGYGEYGIIIFTPPQNSPYELPLLSPGEIPLKIALASDSNKEWTVSLKIMVKVKLDNFENYINDEIIGSLKYQFYDCAYEPCSNTASQYPVRLIVSPGNSEGNITLYTGTPTDIAIVESIQSYYEDITLPFTYVVKIPPGYYGGLFSVDLAGIGYCQNTLPGNPGSTYEYVTLNCNITVGRGELIDFFVKPYGLLTITITSSTSNHPFYLFEIYGSSRIIEFSNLPYIKLPYTTTQYFITPIVAYNKISDNYLSKPIVREVQEVNKHGVINNLNRWLDIRWTLGSHTYMLINFGLSPTGSFNDRNNYDAGDLESFTVIVSWSGQGSCIDPMVRTRAIIESTSPFSNADLNELFNWINSISSWLNTKSRIAGLVSSGLSIVNLVLDYKDLTEVTVEKWCTGSGVPGGSASAYVRVSGEEAGWNPSELADSIDIYIDNYVFDESLCVRVEGFSLYLTTEEGYVSYDYDSVGLDFCPLGSLYGGAG